MEEKKEVAVKRPLPTFQELHHDPDEAFKNDQFKLLVNKAPIEKWLKPHPLAKVKNEKGHSVPARYLPTDKVEFLMDYIFQNWKVEVLREGIMFQSVYVTVRIHYQHPVNGEWFFHDGVGSKSVQSDSGMPFSADSIKDAGVQMALPAAKSYAIKDACDHIGRLFGRDINRANTVDFSPAYMGENGKPKATEEDTRLITIMRSCKNRKELEKQKPHCATPEHNQVYDEMWVLLEPKTKVQ